MAARIDGADSLRDLGKTLRAAGDPGKGLRREVLAEIRETAKGPLLTRVRQAMGAKLPSRGGLARTFSDKVKLSVRTRLSGSQAGVTALVSVPEVDLPKIEAGSLRHPVYGRGKWVTQKITPNVVADAADDVADDVAQAVLDAVDSTTRKV